MHVVSTIINRQMRNSHTYYDDRAVCQYRTYLQSAMRLTRIMYTRISRTITIVATLLGDRLSTIALGEREERQLATVNV